MSDNIEVSCEVDGRESRDQSENPRAAAAQEGAQSGPALASLADLVSAAVPKLPTGPGIYFLIREGVIVYVGKSKRIGHRIAGHMVSRGGDFDSWSYVACEIEALDVLEARYIREFDPIHNLHRASYPIDTRSTKPGWPPDPRANLDRAIAAAREPG